MFTYEFEYTSPRTGRLFSARLDQDQEVINVTIGNIYLGGMIEDAQSPFGFVTNDRLLQDELAYFTMAYKEALAIENLPMVLQRIYGPGLISWAWTSDKDLKLIAHPEMDLKGFAEILRDQIGEAIMFDKSLTIFIAKEGSAHIEEIFVN